jgi:hypothetical protein
MSGECAIELLFFLRVSCPLFFVPEFIPRARVRARVRARKTRAGAGARARAIRARARTRARGINSGTKNKGNGRNLTCIGTGHWGKIHIFIL